MGFLWVSMMVVDVVCGNINKTDMKKSPVKVIVRLRPTANFAHKEMTVDEQSG